MLPVLVSAGHSTAGDIDCHPAAGTVNAAGLGCTEGTDHNSTDWVVPGTFARSLAEDWCADEYCFQRPALRPPLLSLHLFALIINNNSAVHQRLEIRVCIGYKLELQTIIQTLEKVALLISIIRHLIRSVM